MEIQAKRHIPPIIRQVIQEGSRFTFHQALNLLEEAWFGSDSISTENHGKICLKPSKKLSFPAADIYRAQVDHRGYAEFELNFMGLYGVDSPLPLFFSALAAQNNESAERLRQFLNVLNQRIYFLFYLAWKKYHIQVQLEGKKNRYLHYLQFLSGKLLQTSDSVEYAYTGLLGDRQHSSAGLANLLFDYLGGVKVCIKNFQPQWVELTEFQPLSTKGRHFLLGDNIVLGERMIDVVHNVVICMGPFSTKDALALLPGQEKSIPLHSLIKRYLKPTLHYVLRLFIQPVPGSMCELGQPRLFLGWSTWLGAQQTSEYSIEISGENFN